MRRVALTLALLGCGDDGGTDDPFGTNCCEPDDPLERLSTARSSEVVDVQTDGRFVFACGGFGASIHDLSDPAEPTFVGSATQRCQHAQPGPMVGGARIVYFAHHGDSYAGGPRLHTWRVGDGPPAPVGVIRDDDVLFEGMAYADGYLYVAAHQGGLRVYRVADDGQPELAAVVGELGNAWKVELLGSVAYVVDNAFGLHVLDVSSPEDPRLLGSVPTSGPPRDLAVDGDRLYVALGSLGVDVLDATTPATPVPVAHVETLGSAQSVAAAEGVFSVAAWSHLAVYDAGDQRLLATQRTRERTEFEQDLGVVQIGRTLVLGEWEALHIFRWHPNRAAPDLWLEQDLYAFADRADAQAVVVRNVGQRALEVALSVDDAALTIAPATLTVPAGGAAVAELTYTPPGAGYARLRIESNDPDEPTAELLVDVTASDRIGVGDRLDDSFAFLDPTGANQLAGLEGQVVVLAYFALF